MDGLSDLYQEVILDHYRRPRNFGLPPEAERQADGHNPLCGDRVRVAVHLDGGRIAAIGFEGSGCAISTASASLMTEAVRGRTLDEVHALFQRFHDLVTLPAGEPGAAPDGSLGKLEALAGVREFPMRVKCATLAWHTLEAALEGATSAVSTE
ncbi:MAG TPA: SUF system NifU family Fe-S cluster assembly protein [Thermoanaerobaculia bacterium]|jgi:nitrogen fixation NifU-like protein|nr:SUF system NifU family Fe-S cluster assembly protein [Thermoanaerobaculia bacterium]HQN40215.1 SUF system NifU family Fe-S cluster assembly protein [Thermoanaerobaculia bacterium]